MKILLISPYTFWKGENEFQVLKQRNFNENLGIRYIASSLEQRGHTVDIIDAHFEEIDDIREQGIITDGYDVYGITFVEAILEEMLSIVRHIKELKHNANIVIGGYGATFLGKQLVVDCPDICAAVVSEGEKTSVELFEAIYEREKWPDIKGIIFAENGKTIATKPRALIHDIDSLPWPSRGALYKHPRANILASRGCYGKCTYCSISEFYGRFEGSNVRIRRAKSVVDEMEYVANTFGVHYFDFVDDNFTCTCNKNMAWAVEFVEEIKHRNLKITWGIQARANDIDYDLFTILYDGGLRVVSVGIENDVPRVINMLKTGTTKEIHRRAIDILKRIGINMYIEMILLEPTSSLSEIRENLDFLYEIDFSNLHRQNPITFSTKLHLYIGTPVVKQMQERGLVWTEKYHVHYNFQDKKVQLLSDILIKWQEKTASLATYQLSYFQYEAGSKGDYGLAMKIMKLSRKYLKLDLDFYSSVVDRLINDDEVKVVGDVEDVFALFHEQSLEIGEKFNRIVKRVLLKGVSD